MEIDWTKIIFGLVIVGLIVFAVIRGFTKPAAKHEDGTTKAK